MIRSPTTHRVLRHVPHHVANRAIRGRSSRTFITEGRWDQVLKDANSGDFVLIQFGHNDGIAPDDPQRPRGTLPGTGEETRQITHPQTHQPEVVHTYGWYLASTSPTPAPRE
jgi:lysophospholipase L1-like esterase